MPLPDGSLTDHECRVEILRLAQYLDEHHADDVKMHPSDLPTDLVIRLLSAEPVCGSCGKDMKYGPLCVNCQ